MLTFLIIASYLMGIALFLLIARPIGIFSYQTFTLAPGFFMTLSVSMLGFFLYYDGHTVVHGNYLLNPVTYVCVFLYNMSEILVTLLAMVLAYRWSISRPLKSYFYIETSSFGYALTLYFFLAVTLGLILLLHAKFQFAYLLEPRRLYELTRQGYGHFYFIMSITMKLTFVMALFWGRSGMLLVFLMAIALATGAKSNAFVLFLIFIGYRIIFRYKNRVPAPFVFALVGVAVGLAVVLFSMTFRAGVLSSPLALGKLTASFLNEANNNAVLLIDQYGSVFRDYRFGSIFMEDNLLTRIPRLLYPGKPTIFGSFRLADAFFYRETAMGVGAKTFGAIGNSFADFGFGAFPRLMFQNVFFYTLAGVVLGRLVRIARQDHGFLHFAILLILCDVYFVHVPPGDNLPENLLIVVLIGIVAGFRKVTLKPAEN